MNITRRLPPMVAQTLEDSCWAAALESWSRVDPKIRDVRQQDLIDQYGETDNGGITPVTQIPLIAQDLDLMYGGFEADSLEGYVRQHLPSGHLFCAYTRGTFTHAVVIYRLSDRRNVSYMDPDGGHDRWKPLDWFLDRGPYVLMRRR